MATEWRLGKHGITCAALLCSAGSLLLLVLGLIQHSRKTAGAQQLSHLAKGPAIVTSVESE